jgi:hypothetical protein
MRPRRRLPRRSWRLEHNQCHSLYLFPAFPLSRKSDSTENILAPRSPVATLSPLSQQGLEQPFKQGLDCPQLRGLNRFAQGIVAGVFVQYEDMAVTIEMQNTGDPRARREILAGVEHVLSDVAGEWRVSIVGSRADDNWEMKVEGPRGFERSYTLVGKAGEHQPEAIRNVLIKLLPPRPR